MTTWEQRAMELGNYGIEIWSNYSCMGYALVAAAKCGMSFAEISRLHDTMADLMRIGGENYIPVLKAGGLYQGSPWFKAIGEGS